MILRDEDVGAITMRCDECGELLDGDFNADDFQAMIDYAKGHDWSVSWGDTDGEWTHTCPTCSGGAESRLERAKRVLGQR